MTTSQSAGELLPCPCCGYEAVFGSIGISQIEADNPPDAGGEFVQCTNAMCGLSSCLMFPLMDDVKGQLAERWNTRAHLSQASRQKTDRLLPCPFCGDAADWFPDEVGSGGQHVGPYHAGCHGCSMYFTEHECEDAIGSWNRRSQATERADGVITEEMWGGLARDIVFWHDTNTDRQPASLFQFLERMGTPIPQWLRDEPELQNLNHAISKGTRAVIIYKAMLSAAPAASVSADARDGERMRYASALQEILDAPVSEGNLEAGSMKLIVVRAFSAASVKKCRWCDLAEFAGTDCKRKEGCPRAAMKDNSK